MAGAAPLSDPAAHPGFRFGVGLRRRHYEALLGAPPLPGLDFFEVVPENFLDFGGLPRRALEAARARVPVVTHGISLSLGSPDALDEEYLDRLRVLLDSLDVPWHSDHVSVSSAHGVEYHDLLPVPLTGARQERMAARARAAAARLGRPLLVENPTVYTRLPGETMDEPEFLTGLLAASGCGLLLDLNNVWVNCRNHGGDPVAYLEALPADCVGQIHLAGHRVDEPLTVDSHGAPVSDEVRELYRAALRRFGPAWTVLERDQDVPPLEELLEELAELRADAEVALRVPELSIHLPVLPDASPPPDGDAEASARLLHEVVVGSREPRDVAAELGVPVEGLCLYRSFFRRHHREILEMPYRVLFALLDPETRERLVREYQAAHPMAHREINANAAAFPGWLAERVVAGERGLGVFHVELATLERARFEAYSMPVELEDDRKGGAPRLNPTVSALRLAYPVADFLDAWSAARSAGEDPPEVPASPLPEPEVLLVFRDPKTLHARVVRGTPRLLFALKMLHEGLSPAEAGERAGRDAAFGEAALAEAVEHGLALVDGPSGP